MSPISPTFRGVSLLIALLAAIAAPRATHAQQVPADSVARRAPLGTWRGTSICTPGHPACHDETVVYRIRAAGARFEISASKIVQGQEEFMGTVTCDYTADTRALVCAASYGTWSFTLTGETLTGTLVVRGELYRRVQVTRSDG